jgi:hypothetical protein
LNAVTPPNECPIKIHFSTEGNANWACANLRLSQVPNLYDVSPSKIGTEMGRLYASEIIAMSGEYPRGSISAPEKNRTPVLLSLNSDPNLIWHASVLSLA